MRKKMYWTIRVLKDIEQHAERNNLSILQAVDEWIKHEIGKE